MVERLPDFDRDPVRLRDTLDSLREGIQILAPDWRYVYVNEAVALHGRKRREELLGRSMLECYPGIEQTEVFSVLERCMRERSSDSLENEFVYADGERAWFELRIHPCREGLIVLSLDITSRKRLEASLRQAYKLRALGQMAAGVAHDLRNILNPLGLRLSLLERELGPRPDLAESLEQMRAALTRGAQTIDLLRNFARQAPETTSAEPTELDAIASEAIALSRPRVAEQAARIALEDALGGAPRARVSPPELLSALVNLITNAIEAMPEGGRVTVSSGAAEDRAWLEVRDTGPGMPAEVQKRAFEPFFTTKGDAGTGLGLAMVWAFALRHHGRVELASDPGEGTRVRLEFPAA